jgi:hypothetical protein
MHNRRTIRTALAAFKGNIYQKHSLTNFQLGQTALVPGVVENTGDRLIVPDLNNPTVVNTGKYSIVTSWIIFTAALMNPVNSEQIQIRPPRKKFGYGHMLTT